MASVSIEVEVVQAATTAVRVIAESLGGFVEQLSSSGGREREQANMTIRVPQAQFFDALERIEALGEVQNRNMGSEDVSERFIDLKARLQSSLGQEKSLISLLEKAGTVSEILTIERELARVRSEIERFQGQLNFLERRVALATISVSLFPPQEEGSKPPSASLVIETSDVAGRVDEVKALVSGMNGATDQVFISVQDGRQRASISIRVFTANFGQAMSSLEGMGEVRTKELREGTTPGDGEETPPKKPDARIAVSFQEEEPSETGLVVAVLASIGGVLVALLGGVFFLAYRMGRGRRAQT